MNKFSLLLVAAIGAPAICLLGCAKQAAPAATPSEAAPAAETSEPETFPGKDPEQGQLMIGPKIAEICGIEGTDTLFSYNSAKVSPAAKKIFVQVVECFTEGPLAGKGLRLIGHADPRGDEEYNMTLGGRRADNVGAVLSQLGMPASQMETSSRGEMDATGEDEAGWKLDRKVELYLAE